MKRVLIVILLILAACSGGGEAPARDSLTGTVGVVVTAENTPDRVIEGEEFPMVFRIDNRGVFPVTSRDPGFFSVSYDKLYLSEEGGISRYPSNAFWLEGRDLYSLGEDTYITYYFSANEINRNSQQVQTEVLFNICYPYESNTTTQICIEQDPYAPAGAVACRGDTVRPNSPGSPIVVEEIDVRSRRLGDNQGIVPTFHITFRNTGNGIPGISACGDQDLSLLNQAEVKAYLLNEELDCGEGIIRFTRNVASIVCAVPDFAPIQRGQGNFATLLSIDVDFIYRDSERVGVTVVRA